MLTTRKRWQTKRRCCDRPSWPTRALAEAALDRRKRVAYATAPSDVYRCKNGSYHMTERSDPTQDGLSEWERIKAGVFKRDGHRCIVCGSSRRLDAHHRRLQSQSGADVPQNLVTLCRADHDRVHDRPLEAAKAGLIVRSGADPLKVPVEHREWDEPIYLTGDFQYGAGAA